MSQDVWDKSFTEADKLAQQSNIKFESAEEEEQFRNDFKAALVFSKKLDEIDVSGVNSLENVLDFYGGL